MSIDCRGGRWLQFLTALIGLLTYQASAFRKYDEDLALVAMAYSHAAYAVIPFPSDFTLIGNVTRSVIFGDSAPQLMSYSLKSRAAISM